MRIGFSKYHALGNDFLVIDKEGLRIGEKRMNALAQAICDRRLGVGADGILLLSKSSKADCRIDVYNADGSWAEKSGNGLRIAAVHKHRSSSVRISFRFQIGTSLDLVTISRSGRVEYMAKAQLAVPDYLASHVPVIAKSRYFINRPLRAAGKSFRATCLSVGNPHTVIAVDSFDFDWKRVGEVIEHAKMFPHGTNVEFVKVVSRRRVQVADWERGAGATGSSGTGAVAAVSAMVMLGLVERACEAVFEGGTLLVSLHEDGSSVDLSGPVRFVMRGEFEFI